MDITYDRHTAFTAQQITAEYFFRTHWQSGKAPGCLNYLSASTDRPAAALDTYDIEQQLLPPLQLPGLASRACFGATNIAEATTRDVRLTLANRDSTVSCRLSTEFLYLLLATPSLEWREGILVAIVNQSYFLPSAHALPVPNAMSFSSLSILWHPEEDTDHLFFLCPVKHRFWEISQSVDEFLDIQRSPNLSVADPRTKYHEQFRYLWRQRHFIEYQSLRYF
jgi:hypothetical protein